MSKPVPKSSANKNWLLVQFRKWHGWGGAILSLFILVVAVTGILLNHKDLFFHGEAKKEPHGLLMSSTDLRTLPVSFDRALAISRDHYGDVPLEKIELKDERGWLHYKVARGDGDEIRIDAQTAEATHKYGANLKAGGATAYNWAKIVDDLHTGQIFGTAGKLTVDVTSGVIIVLTLTGLYLWVVPLLRKRQSKSRQAANPVPARRSPSLDALPATPAAAAELVE
ncbi:MAG: PepSY-associated TM helix domain-containing protein [Pirellulaceae bacterium]